MEDSRIVALYWARNEDAIAETDRKYGGYCRTIAMNILSDHGDAEECVNDTWLQAWNAIPPHRPAVLSAFLGAITRRLSLDRCAGTHGKNGAAARCPWPWRSCPSASRPPADRRRPPGCPS